MDVDLLIKALIAIVPVIAFLITFDRLDVFDLISSRAISLLLLGGAGIAGLSLLANGGVMDGFPIGFSAHTRYVAPVIEESLKALPIIILFAMNRLGYKLDAGIAGFAIGAGFSVVENIWYLLALSDANFSAWLVRGFGTAVMHGGATALFAVVSHEMTERQAEEDAAKYRFNPFLFLPGLGLAIIIHSTFNHFPNQPIAIMAITLAIVPLVLFFTFFRNEQATNRWLEADARAHRQRLKDIRSGVFAESKRGKVIERIMASRCGKDIEDVNTYLELKTALILRAEKLILAKQEGFDAEVSAEDVEKFEELASLEARLGDPLLRTLEPHLGFSRNDLWELSRLYSRVRRYAKKPKGQSNP